MPEETKQVASEQAVFLPSTGAFFAVFFYASLLFGCPYIFLKDGGTARHINTGAYILEHHAVPTTNYTWYLDPSYPWLTHEFATDIIFGAIEKYAGLNGIVLLSASVLTAVLLWSYQIARKRGLGAIISWIMFWPMLLTTTMHWSARPHLFSYLLFVSMYYLHLVSKASLVQRVWLTALLSAIWVNLHGSPALGLMIVAARFGGDILDNLIKYRGVQGFKFKALLSEFLPLLAACVAICLNIRGPGLYLYVWQYLTNPTILHQGGEWLPFTLSFGVQAYTCLFVVGLALLLLALSRKVKIAELGVFLALIYASSHAMRVAPYCVLVAFIISGPAWAALRDKYSQIKIVRPFFNIEQFIEKHEKFKKMTTVGALISALALSLYFMVKLDKQTDFYPGTMPVKTSEYIGAHCQGKVVFAIDNWGPYLYWKFKRPVFIDDKTDFYPRHFYDDYMTILSGQGDWQKVLERYHVDYILVFHDQALEKALKTTKNWKLVDQDMASVLYERR